MAEKNIVVEIFREDLIELKPYAIVPYIVSKLKDAGIPAKGIILFQGVETGTLYQEENFVNNSYIFIWKKD